MRSIILKVIRETNTGNIQSVPYNENKCKHFTVLTWN